MIPKMGAAIGKLDRSKGVILRQVHGWTPEDLLLQSAAGSWSAAQGDTAHYHGGNGDFARAKGERCHAACVDGEGPGEELDRAVCDAGSRFG